MDSIWKMMHLASVNDTFKVVRFFRNGVLKCRNLACTQDVPLSLWCELGGSGVLLPLMAV